MKALALYLKARLGGFLGGRTARPPVPAEVQEEVDAYLDERRSTINHWFFLVRLTLGLGLAGYLAVEAFTLSAGLTVEILLVLSYVLANIGLRVAWGATARYVHWAYAALDLVFFLLLRHLFLFEAVVDPNATLVSLFTLLLIAYTYYSDPKLSSALVLGMIGATAATLGIDAFRPTGPALSADARLQPLQAVLLLGYLSAVCLVTYPLTLRLYEKLLAYSVELHRRTQAAVAMVAERERRERLEELNEVKHNFIAVLSHELRTPITPLLSALDFAEAELSSSTQPCDAEIMGEMVSIAHDSALRLQRLVQDYTQLAGLLTLDAETLTLRNVRLADLLEVLLDHTHRAHFTLDAPEDLVVAADPRLLGGALLALLRRADLLTPPGQAASFTAREEDGVVTLTLHDPLSYVDPETIQALDDPFGFSNERLYYTPNTGIELTLALHALRRLGGTLHVESTRGAGTHVTCTLPVGHPQADWIEGSQLRFEVETAGV